MFTEHYINIKGQKLNSYSRSVGGGMTGGYYRESVKRNGAQAVISTVEASFHNEEPVKCEYVVDATILDEIEDLVRKYRINFWNRKKFTNMFISDGESESFSFEFDKNGINFSSQIYPEKYGAKLKEIKEIVKKYI